MDTYAIEADSVTKVYLNRQDEVHALKPISFRIHPGEFVSLVGPSGCGKSTVLSLMAGLIRPSSGCLRIFGKEVTAPSNRVSYMLQQDCLLDWRDRKSVV